MDLSRSQRSRLIGICSLAALLGGLLFALIAQAAGQPHHRHPRLQVGHARHAGWHSRHQARLRADPDRDRLTTRREVRRYRTNPHRFDTDRDRYGDGAEVRAGSSPRNPNSTPAWAAGPAPERPAVLPSEPADPTSGPEPAVASAVAVSPSAAPAASPAPPAAAAPTSPAPTPPAPPPPPPPPPADTAPPETTIGSGPSGATTDTAAAFAFSSSESGSSFECRLDAGAWVTCGSPRSYAGLPPGPHQFEVRAIDAAGNVDPTPASREWTVLAEEGPGEGGEEEGGEGADEGGDTAPPSTTIGSGPSGATTDTAAAFAFSSSESGSSFECRLDAGAWVTCGSPRSYAGLPPGPHQFEVRAIDAAGNVDPTPASREWTVLAEEDEGGEGGADPGAPPCTQNLPSGANVSTAIANAPAGAVLCLPPGAASFSISGVSKSATVTVRGGGGSVRHSVLRRSSNLRFEGILFTGGLELLGATSGIEIVDNEFTGPYGIHAGGEAHTFPGSKVSGVLIEGNYMHDLDYTGSQGVANGYGITASDGVADFVIRGNTIKSPASDYVQSASPVDFVVEGNTFLGPSLLGSHADHQDLWQIFGGGTDIVFRDNVARHTETQESLLFQEGRFENVVVENNLFDHDSRGYTCQIYQSTGLVFRDNTVVGSRWGCLFRDLASAAPGSGYEIDHNVFVGTTDDTDVSTEGRAASWGVYDYNVSEDGSARGSHSVRNWQPTWADPESYVPAGLPFEAGYRP